MKKPRIVVVGSSNTDMVIKLERIPEPGETVLGGKFTVAAGGKGANQAVAASRAGGDVHLIACLGDDIFGEQAVDGFREDGINVEHLTRVAGSPSGVALIFVDRSGENSIAVASGANALLSPDHIQSAKDLITNADILLLQLETPLESIRTAIELASDHGVRIILNPAPARPLDAALLQRISILTPNESEVQTLTRIEVTDERGARKAACNLLSKGIETVLITMGPRGVWTATREFQRSVPSFPVDPIDTTAAGDVFNGALAVSLAEATPLLEALRFANAAAALSVIKMGAQPSAPERREIDAFLKKQTIL